MKKVDARNLVVLLSNKSKNASNQSQLKGRDIMFNDVNVTELNATVNFNYFCISKFYLKKFMNLKKGFQYDFKSKTRKIFDFDLFLILS